MTNIKTAVSINESLFKRAEDLAYKLEITRSKLVSTALEDYIRQYENKQLLKQINKTYDNKTSSDEQAYQMRMKKYHERFAEGEW